MQITKIFGIDFSGAVTAGRKIWIAEATVESDSLRIDSCIRACDLVDSGSERDRCLTALREFLGRPGNDVYGLDFPFGLPAVLVKQASWTEFVLSFRDQYETPAAFREACTQIALQETGSKERKRQTDDEAKTPFSPYNLRLFRQTFFGIRDVLAPLVRGGRIRVLPMQEPEVGLPIVIEICPASTLKSMGIMESYKKSRFGSARASILDAVTRKNSISIPDDMKRQIIEDKEGDALDSIIAAAATWRALKAPCCDVETFEPYLLEGFVYV
ncbi:DUF429 domain-containing protein [soil metagenome]